MSTRRLILASLLCGIAILVAGGLKLFQTTADGNRVDAALLRVGEAASVAGLDVAVVDVARTDMATLVTVTMSRDDTALGSDAAPSDDAAMDVVTGWRMLADGALTSPRDVDAADVGTTTNDCDAIPATGSVTCVLDFGVANGTPTFIYSRDGSQAQWLAGT